MAIGAVDRMTALSSEGSPSSRGGRQLIFKKDEHLQSIEYRTKNLYTLWKESVEDSQPGRAFWRRSSVDMVRAGFCWREWERRGDGIDTEGTVRVGIWSLWPWEGRAMLSGG